MNSLSLLDDLAIANVFLYLCPNDIAKIEVAWKDLQASMSSVAPNYVLKILGLGDFDAGEPFSREQWAACVSFFRTRGIKRESGVLHVLWQQRLNAEKSRISASALTTLVAHPDTNELFAFGHSSHGQCGPAGTRNHPANFSSNGDNPMDGSGGSMPPSASFIPGGPPTPRLRNFSWQPFIATPVVVSLEEGCSGKGEGEGEEEVGRTEREEPPPPRLISSDAHPAIEGEGAVSCGSCATLSVCATDRGRVVAFGVGESFARMPLDHLQFFPPSSEPKTVPLPPDKKARESEGDCDSKRDGPRLPSPLPLGLGRRAVQVSCGYMHVLVLSMDGCVFSWGQGLRGQLGLGLDHQRNSPPLVVRRPQKVLFPSSSVEEGEGDGEEERGGKKGAGKSFSSYPVVVGVAAGGLHSAAVTADGKAFTWGAGSDGQLGVGIPPESLTSPRAPSPLSLTSAASPMPGPSEENSDSAGASSPSGRSNLRIRIHPGNPSPPGGVRGSNAPRVSPKKGGASQQGSQTTTTATTTAAGSCSGGPNAPRLFSASASVSPRTPLSPVPDLGLIFADRPTPTRVRFTSFFEALDIRVTRVAAGGQRTILTATFEQANKGAGNAGRRRVQGLFMAGDRKPIPKGDSGAGSSTKEGCTSIASCHCGARVIVAEPSSSSSALSRGNKSQARSSRIRPRARSDLAHPGRGGACGDGGMRPTFGPPPSCRTGTGSVPSSSPKFASPPSPFLSHPTTNHQNNPPVPPQPRRSTAPQSPPAAHFRPFSDDGGPVRGPVPRVGGEGSAPVKIYPVPSPCSNCSPSAAPSAGRASTRVSDGSISLRGDTQGAVEVETPTGVSGGVDRDEMMAGELGRSGDGGEMVVDSESESGTEASEGSLASWWVSERSFRGDPPASRSVGVESDDQKRRHKRRHSSSVGPPMTSPPRMGPDGEVRECLLDASLFTLVSVCCSEGCRICDAATGKDHVLILSADGSLRGWGSNAAGQLGPSGSSAPAVGVGGEGGPEAEGLEDLEERPHVEGIRLGPLGANQKKKVVAIGVGGNHSLVVDSDGVFWGFGQGDVGQLGCGGDCPTFSVPSAVRVLVRPVSQGGGGGWGAC
uniref:Uncharacterized protein n=1 Tax=Chromera velia CCMP2878 TaxID=1169474 RepID=A0A0G4HAM8_9ALVE|eukprot:Cvel_6105.t1-p1 / transcript=Cvel_6105.t1 / gene=Cvel_6105 / organism=Chromera_velia_CCMP2878 / gene_product=hypothetical protein / transcript_product=hypothetical protein / location=Cvel_scaffold294:57108-62202(-) / protein_length=1096 / sequence_SO=supercontig / SO=protein_coding / is_pseudo=false